MPFQSKPITEIKTETMKTITTNEYRNLIAGKYQAEAQRDKLLEALKWFVKRCENGEIRSTKTYARFQELIEETT